MAVIFGVPFTLALVLFFIGRPHFLGNVRKRRVVLAHN
jgi:hypothetical protein